MESDSSGLYGSPQMHVMLPSILGYRGTFSGLKIDTVRESCTPLHSHEKNCTPDECKSNRLGWGSAWVMSRHN